MFLRRKKFIFSLIIFLILVLYQRLNPSEQVLSEQIQLTLNPSPNPRGEQPIRQDAEVVRVIDGDTIEVQLNNQKEKVRIIGINTPETVDPRKTVQCFGKEASEFAINTLTGQKITLEADESQANIDKYGRLLRYVFVNEIDYGKLMITKGFAHEYTYSLPYKFQAEYKIAEKKAQEGNLGLWQNETCAVE